MGWLIFFNSIYSLSIYINGRLSGSMRVEVHQPTLVTDFSVTCLKCYPLDSWGFYFTTVFSWEVR